ncbi:hypothetical protein LB465_12050 [Salegentibacter sp. LM13S]|uniref:hypothetical protein n=1 Tax=Salegentibacter lacus TaxID=2873599 RepID=UPI001CCC853B|nr:hypothetical protein [Salegentibacter lacus]MBZ9631514.1 hypothetical protein [Salegentibacter lacus]
MDWIEILGIPGAGKTSLLENLKSTSINNRIKQTWYPEQTVRCGIIKNIKQGNFELASKLLQAKIFSNQKLNNKEKWKALIRAHEDEVEALDLPEEFRYKLISFYSNLITKVSQYSDLGLSKPVFLDEGIIHNNYFRNNDLLSFKRHMFCLPKLVFYLEADVLEVAKELKNSNSFESRGMAGFKLLSLSETESLLRKIDYRTQEKIIFLEENKVPVIKLNRQNSQQENDLIRIHQKIIKVLKKGL